MKVESLFLLGVGVFFGIVGVIYWFTSYEDAGFLMLLGATGLGLLPGAYYLWWSRHMKPRLEDIPEASIDEGAGTIDAFPGSSIWPFMLGMGAFTAALSFVFGTWLAPIAAGLILWALIGVTVESRRGGTV
jgi:Cytochrome c oxidase subunit IV